MQFPDELPHSFYIEPAQQFCFVPLNVKLQQADPLKPYLVEKGVHCQRLHPNFSFTWSTSSSQRRTKMSRAYKESGFSVLRTDCDIVSIYARIRGRVAHQAFVRLWARFDGVDDGVRKPGGHIKAGHPNISANIDDESRCRLHRATVLAVNEHLANDRAIGGAINNDREALASYGNRGEDRPRTQAISRE